MRVDGEVAAFVPRIFELAAEGRWWRSKLEGQVRELGCPGLRQRANELYGHNRHAMEGWDYAAIRSMVTNPFYTRAPCQHPHAQKRHPNRVVPRYRGTPPGAGRPGAVRGGQRGACAQPLCLPD